MASNASLTPNPGNEPLSRHAPAYDGTNVDLTGGDYTPTGTQYGRGIYVGGYASGTTPGNVVVMTAGGNQVTFYNVPPGSIIPQAFSKILQSGTTATDLVAMV